LKKSIKDANMKSEEISKKLHDLLGNFEKELKSDNLRAKVIIS
jgi:hypothetical protein